MSAKTRNPDVGDQPVLFVDVTDADGVAANPANGRLLIQKPGETASTEVAFGALTVAPGGVVGRVEYTMPTPLDVPGVWRFYWEFTAGVVGAEPFSFKVDARPVSLPV
jgi:hypothetical protein